MTALFKSRDDAPTPPADVNRLNEENQRLHRAVEELSILNDIALAINSTMEPEAINQMIVGKCVRRLGAQQGSIHLFGETDTDPTKTLVRVFDRTGGGMSMPLRIQLTGWMFKNRKPLLVSNLATDERFAGAETHDQSLKSVLSVPLELKGRLIGIINIFNKQDGEFTNEDARLVAIIASQCAQVIENARLYAEEKKLKVLREEVKNAAQIQMALLPHATPVIPGAEIAAAFHPARDVGGDYYDYIDLGDNRWGIVVGDVSGKGMPAALLMANLQATVRGCARSSTSVADCVSTVNRLLVGSTDARTFVTLFYSVYDAQAKTLTYCNAGHNPPYRSTADGNMITLTTGGPIVAAFGWSQYEQETIQLETGERLVVFTDGVTEAANPQDEQFGEPRLEELLRRNAQAKAGETIEHVLAAVLKFQAEAPVADDITLVCLRT